jgi:hypothetical protein
VNNAGEGGFRYVGLLNLNVWVRVMMMREFIYSLQWLSLKELSCQEDSFVNKTIWEYYHTIIGIILDGFGLGSPQYTSVLTMYCCVLS